MGQRGRGGSLHRGVSCMSVGRVNQRRGKEFEKRAVQFINEYAATGVQAVRLDRHDYGKSQEDIILVTSEGRKISVDCKYTKTYFTVRDKENLLNEAIGKYDKCIIIMGQCFGKSRMYMPNCAVLIPYYVQDPSTRERKRSYLETPLESLLFNFEKLTKGF